METPEDKQKLWSQFFTPEATARKCWAWLQEQLGEDKGVSEMKPFGNRFFVEPSAGIGAFLRLMPVGMREGYEIDASLIEKQDPDLFCFERDFLALKAPKNPPSYEYIVVGNPPFGFRGREALAFINHAFAIGADYVAFILPPMFKPYKNGKPPVVEGRIKGGYSVGWMEIEPEFDMPVGPETKKTITGCAFVLYKKGVRPGQHREKPLFEDEASTINISDYFDICFVANREGRRDAVHRIPECDCFLGDSFYPGEKPELKTKLEDCPSSQGHGIIIKKDRERVLTAFASADWETHSRTSPHTVRHINQTHVKDAVAAELAKPAIRINDYISVHTIRTYRSASGKCSPTGMQHADKCDIYLPNSMHHGQRHLLKPYGMFVYGGMFGVKIKKDKPAVVAAINRIDWLAEAKTSTNGNVSLGVERIKQAVAEELKKGIQPTHEDFVVIRSVYYRPNKKKPVAHIPGNHAGMQHLEKCSVFVPLDFYKKEGFAVDEWTKVKVLKDGSMSALGVEFKPGAGFLREQLLAVDWGKEAKDSARGQSHVTRREVEEVVERLIRPRKPFHARGLPAAAAQILLDHLPPPRKATCERYLRLMNISSYNGFDRIDARAADVFIPRALREGVVKREGFRVVKSLPAKPEHIGAILLKQKGRLRKLLLNHDWLSVARQSSNGSYTIRQQDVRDVVIGAGFID